MAFALATSRKALQVACKATGKKAAAKVCSIVWNILLKRNVYVIERRAHFSMVFCFCDVPTAGSPEELRHRVVWPEPRQVAR